MTTFPDADGALEQPEPGNSFKSARPADGPSPGKVARILDEEEGSFLLEYDDSRGQKNTMRLDALTYEGAIREARSFLGIQPDDHDEDGDKWSLE
jgi:hypothetical protein